jgi:hypothetical protein
VARQGPAAGLNSSAQIHARPFCGQQTIPENYSGKRFYSTAADEPPAPQGVLIKACRSRLALRCVLGRGHDPTADLAHMLAGIGELALQELRLNLHGLLKIGGVNQFARVIESGLHILFGERQRLFGNLVPGLDTDVTDLLAASKNIPNAFSA